MISMTIPWVVGILLLGVFHSARGDDGLMIMMRMLTGRDVVSTGYGDRTG